MSNSTSERICLTTTRVITHLITQNKIEERKPESTYLSRFLLTKMGTKNSQQTQAIKSHL